MVQQIAIPDPPSAKVDATFAPAVSDLLSPESPSGLAPPMHHTTFVDNNLMAETQARIRLSIQWSFDSCYLLFGHL